MLERVIPKEQGHSSIGKPHFFTQVLSIANDVSFEIVNREVLLHMVYQCLPSTSMGSQGDLPISWPFRHVTRSSTGCLKDELLDAMAMAGAVKAAVSSNAKASQLGQLWDRNSKRPVGRDPCECHGGHRSEIPKVWQCLLWQSMATYPKF